MPDQSVWVLTSSGFCKYDETQQRFLPDLQDLPLPQPYNINTFTRFGYTLFFRKKTTYYAYNTQRKTLKSLPDLALYRAFALDENTVLASTWNNNSLWYDFERDTTFQADLPLHFQNKANPALRVFDIARFAPDRYLLVSWQGLFEFRRSTGTYKKLDLFLNGRPVTTNDFANLLFLETENGAGRVAWLATQDGLARFVVNRQQMGLIRLQPPEQVWESSVNYVRRFAEDDRGNLWLATGNGLACLNKAQHRWLFFPPVAGATDRLAHPSVRGLIFDGKYLIVGPTSLGLWLLDPHTLRYRQPRYPPGEEGRKLQQLSEGDFVDEINTLHNGNHLVFGRDAAYLLDGKTYLLRQLDIPPAKENANFAAQGPDGIVWIGIYKGLHCLDAQLNYLHAAPLAKMPFCLFMSDSGALLVASEDGLFEARYRNGQAETRNPFVFSIAAPYWKKGWFLALILALVGAGIYAFIQNRNRKLQQKQEELEVEQVINYFATSLYERATVEEILWDVARNCIGRLHFEDCVIYLFDEQRGVLVQKAAYGPKSPEQFEIVAPLEIPPGQGIVGSVAATGKSEWIRDTRNDPRYIVADRRRLSEIAVPILSNSQVLGVIDQSGVNRR